MLNPETEGKAPLLQTWSDHEVELRIAEIQGWTAVHPSTLHPGRFSGRNPDGSGRTLLPEWARTQEGAAELRKDLRKQGPSARERFRDLLFDLTWKAAENPTESDPDLAFELLDPTPRRTAEAWLLTRDESLR